MTKDQSGGYLFCGQPTIAPSADCQEYAYGKFTYCFDTDGCTGVVQARDAGTCSITFDCTNSQNGAQISCSAQVQQIAPSPTPWIRVDVERVNGNAQNVSQICRVSCTASTCNIQNACDDDANTFTMPKNGIVNRRGGRIELTKPNGDPLVVVGVTPSVDGIYEKTCNGVGGACYVWDAGSWTTGGRSVMFVVASPTPTPSPTGAPWMQLKDSSFQTRDTFSQQIPTSPLAFDADAIAPLGNFILGIAGTVLGKVIPTPPTSNGWSTTDYTPSAKFSPTSFLSYVKARKHHTTITNPNLSEITTDGIYVFDGNLTISGNLNPNAKAVVLLVTGDVTFVPSLTEFNADGSSPSRPVTSLAILAQNITFRSTMTNANGIFIAEHKINTGVSDTGLKVYGNLVSGEPGTNGRSQNSTSNLKPSVFVVTDMSAYAALLPYLSTSKYDFRQLQ